VNIADHLREVADRVFNGTIDQADYEELRGIAAALDPLTVHVLVIEHRHGFDHWTFMTEDEVKDHLLKYVTEWWDNDGPGGPMPTDRDEAINTYFENAHDEFFTTATATVTPTIDLYPED
jgi:hypothetical protein